MPLVQRRDAICWGLGVAATWQGRLSHAQGRGSTQLVRRHTGDIGALTAVDARLGGKPWRCLIDSGASIAVVSPAVAAREDLRVLSSSRVSTAGGIIELKRVQLPPVEIAGEPVDAPQALVLDLVQQLGDAAAGIDGLIGAPTLRRAYVRLDLANDRWQWLGLDAEAPRVGHTIWPLRWDSGLPVVDLILGDRPPATFLLDTGNAGTLVVFSHFTDRLVPRSSDLPRVTLRELGGEVTIHPVLLDRLAAPGYLVRDVPMVFESGAKARRGAHFDRLAGSLGLALFAAGAVALDSAGERLVIELPGLPEVPPVPGGFGMTLQAGGAAEIGPRVQAIFDDGPAALAGVSPGMELRALDGRALGGVPPSVVWRSLHGIERALFTFDALPAPVELARRRFFPRWS